MTNNRNGGCPVFAETFQSNLDAMIDLIAGDPKQPEDKLIGYELERILATPDGRTVSYSGEHGLAALLEQLATMHAADERVFIDGILFGFDYRVMVGGEPVRVTVSLEPASQLEVAVGPSKSVRRLHMAVEAFDADVRRALDAIGSDASLQAVGYNPYVSDPTELELIPKERYRDMDAYLSRHGRHARDMMRCSASTQVSLDYEDEADMARICRMGTLLGPLFAFLFDNAPRFRGAPTPGMARSIIWRHVDVDRCGIVPGSLDGLGVLDYALWTTGVKPILFTDEHHVTTATGDARTREIMAERKLTRGELAHLLSMVFPNIRLKGFCEYREMDSLPPRLAAACTSFTGALFYDKQLEAKLAAALSAWLPRGFELIDENDAVAARLALEQLGWEADVYGVPARAFADALVSIALDNVANGTADIGRAVDATSDGTVPVVRSSPDDRAFDLEGIEMLHDIWRDGRLPRTRLA